MPNFNKLILIGHLTRDLETSYTPKGTMLAKGGIAVNDGYGENRRAMFLDFVAFGKTAEGLTQHFGKGRAALLEGRLTLDQWTDKQTGAKRSKHAMIVDRWGFIDSKPDGEHRPASRQEQADNVPEPDDHADGLPPDDDTGLPF